MMYYNMRRAVETFNSLGFILVDTNKTRFTKKLMAPQCETTMTYLVLLLIKTKIQSQDDFLKIEMNFDQKHD